MMSGTKITGLLQGTTSSGQPNPIDVSETSLQSVTYDEAEGSTLTIWSTAKVSTTINTWKGSGAVNVTNLQSDSGPGTIDVHGTRESLPNPFIALAARTPERASSARFRRCDNQTGPVNRGEIKTALTARKRPGWMAASGSEAAG